MTDHKKGKYPSPDSLRDPAFVHAEKALDSEGVRNVVEGLIWIAMIGVVVFFLACATGYHGMDRFVGM